MADPETCKTIWICSNSQALEKLRSKLSGENKNLTAEHGRENLLLLTWLPGHAVQKSNERADALAEQITEMQCPIADPVVPLFQEIITAHFKEVNRAAWRQIARYVMEKALWGNTLKR